VNLATALAELPGVEIEREWAEANLHDGPAGRNLRSPWKSPETPVCMVDILLHEVNCSIFCSTTL
jgi:hypothetical protein